MDLMPITDKMASAISQNIFPGGVLLCALNHKIIYHKAFGMADIYEKKMVTKETIFDLASLTKPLATALAISRLVENGKLELEQTLGSVLKQFQSTDKETITIDMLLRHTSGLPAYVEYYKELAQFKNDPENRLRQLLIDQPLANDIGTTQDYSDLGFMILSWVIEHLTGESIDTYVYHEFYQPLGIDSLFYIPLEKKNLVTDRAGALIASTQHCPWRNKLISGEVDDDNTWAVGGVDGHAGLFGDAMSVYKICDELLNILTSKGSTVLAEEIILQMVKHKNNHDMVAGFDTPSKKNSSSGKYFSHKSIGHLGFTGTSFWIDPETSLIVVLLTNRVHPTRQNNKLKKFRPEIHNIIYKQILS